jgi:tagatose 6-phosphate kinase
VIVTVTLNTALGVCYQARQVAWDATNQVSGVRYQAAGRGVAVARVLHTFGHEVIAAGLAGGSAGEMIRADLARSGIPADFTAIGRESRRGRGRAADRGRGPRRHRRRAVAGHPAGAERPLLAAGRAGGRPGPRGAARLVVAGPAPPCGRPRRLGQRRG